ncbi:hypothetical protein SGLAU_02070 [Streptomyces glaucescens]|uniref:Uncharacterized protein n=1 Tax=Streptomyces glaucescens TaxID=1907 RepID=A0A089WYE0_STRGA|nr:hypothetical protein SGLAU_02070 [Streptomyces glaucescens]
MRGGGKWGQEWGPWSASDQVVSQPREECADDCDTGGDWARTGSIRPLGGGIRTRCRVRIHRSTTPGRSRGNAGRHVPRPGGRHADRPDADGAGAAFLYAGGAGCRLPVGGGAAGGLRVRRWGEVRPSCTPVGRGTASLYAGGAGGTLAVTDGAGKPLLAPRRGERPPGAHARPAGRPDGHGPGDRHGGARRPAGRAPVPPRQARRTAAQSASALAGGEDHGTRVVPGRAQAPRDHVRPLPRRPAGGAPPQRAFTPAATAPARSAAPSRAGPGDPGGSGIRRRRR